MVKAFSFFFLLILPFALLSQNNPKRPLDHDAYNGWNSIDHHLISRNGQWVSFEINPQEGDGWLHFINSDTKLHDSIPRGHQAAFSPLNDFIVFKIKAQHDTVRKAKLAKKKEDQLPKDSIAIKVFGVDTLAKFPRVKSFTVPEDSGSWIVWHHHKLEEKKDTTKAKEEEEKEEEKQQKKEETKDKKKGKKKDKGPKATDLVLYHPITGNQYRQKDVTGYHVSKNGKLIAFTSFKSDSLDSCWVKVFNSVNEQFEIIFEGPGIAKQITTDDQGSQVAFVHSADTGKTKIYDLYYWNNKADRASVIVTTATEGMPDNWSVTHHFQPDFSESGNRLFLGTNKKPEPEPKDTLTDDEKVKVDVWHWKDGRLQPNQLADLEKDKKRGYLAVYHIKRKKLVQLADETIYQIDRFLKGDGDLAFGMAELPYYHLRSWEYPWYHDAYVIDVNTGDRQLVYKKKQYKVNLSPNGKYVLWYEGSDSSWYAYSVANKKVASLTRQLPVNFYNELSFYPMEATSYGYGGFTKDDQFVLIYDRYDIWKVDPSGKEAPVNLSQGYGRKNNLEMRYVKLDKDEETIDHNEIFLKGYNDSTKWEGFLSLRQDEPNTPIKLIFENYHFERTTLTKAKDADKIIWKKGSFREFPELWLSDLKLTAPKKLTNANPQQQDYSWGTVELVKWKPFKGRQLEGLLYKPDDFNPDKKYPMIVYFYERYSNRYNHYWVPRPTPSIIFPSYYVSNGYIVFVPDIEYGTGHPGNDAYNAVVSGTEYITKMGFVNEDRIGIQGQSWGGYQVAYLVTKTDMYRCAMAGAPVSNMTSAYGGIRWESGLSRMFQYEESQSRIGGTLWDRLDLYIENSPIFHVPNVNTPLLMMHNDNDGAVPWYQGIEYFVALRRLNKPAWLLNYNGDAHNLKRRANQKDLSIRMQQFFDHYLKDEPAPVWLKHGIPAIEKGKTLGYELENKD